jgi:hypothetical protein
MAEEEKDYTEYATKPATPLQERFAPWLLEKTGYNPATAKTKADAFADGVRLSVFLRIPFQASPENRAATEELRAQRAEEAEAARLAREEERAAKAAEREEAAAARAAAKEETAATKSAKAQAKTPAPEPETAAAPASTPAKATGRGRAKTQGRTPAPF